MLCSCACGLAISLWAQPFSAIRLADVAGVNVNKGSSGSIIKESRLLCQNILLREKLLSGCKFIEVLLHYHLKFH